MAAISPQESGLPELPRLNPFLLPSNTGLRFALLVLALIGAGLFAFSSLYVSTHSASFERARKAAATVEVPSYEEFLNSVGGTDTPEHMQAWFEVFAERSQLQGELLSRPYRSLALGELVATLGVLVLAWLISSVAPSVRIRRRHLTPLNPADAPQLCACLAELCAEAGVRPPRLLLEPMNAVPTGQTFGWLGRRWLVLSGGLVASFVRDRATFLAIARHELAHISNRDLSRTQYAVAASYAFTFAAFIPFLVSLLTDRLQMRQDRTYPFDLAWRGIALLVFVFLLRNAILRSRELYADARASVWDGRDGGLVRALASLSKGPSWPRTVWQTHPRREDRLELLATTDRLFRLSFWDAAGAGFAVGVAFESFEMWLQQLVFVSPGASGNYLSAAVFAVFLAGVLGLGVWRSAFASWAHRRQLRSGDRLAIGAGLGLAGGYLLSVEGALGVGMQSPRAFVEWALLVLVGLLVLTRWMSETARAWVGTTTSRMSLSVTFAGFLVVSAGLLALWLGMSMLLQVAEGTDSAGAAVGPVTIIAMQPELIRGSPYLLLTSCLFWALPLAARLRRTTSSVTLAWAFLDPEPSPPIADRQQEIDLRPALRLGLLGAILCTLVLDRRLVSALITGEEQSGAAIVSALEVVAVAGVRGRRAGGPESEAAEALPGSSRGVHHGNDREPGQRAARVGRAGRRSAVVSLCRSGRRFRRSGATQCGDDVLRYVLCPAGSLRGCGRGRVEAVVAEADGCSQPIGQWSGSESRAPLSGRRGPPHAKLCDHAGCPIARRLDVEAVVGAGGPPSVACLTPPHLFGHPIDRDMRCPREPPLRQIQAASEPILPLHLQPQPFMHVLGDYMGERLPRILVGVHHLEEVLV